MGNEAQPDRLKCSLLEKWGGVMSGNLEALLNMDGFWWGRLTIETAEGIAARLRHIFGGRRFTVMHAYSEPPVGGLYGPSIITGVKFIPGYEPSASVLPVQSRPGEFYASVDWSLDSGERGSICNYPSEHDGELPFKDPYIKFDRKFRRDVVARKNWYQWEALMVSHTSEGCIFTMILALDRDFG